ncbi:hypothetical protein OAL10_06820 [Gammaproteobacteria bacterium]|nr:hypothetical protein [Gammaproteobacteria bacterium]
MKPVDPVFIDNNIVSDALTDRLPRCDQFNWGFVTIRVFYF